MCGIVGMSFRKDVSFRDRQVENLRKMFTEMLVCAQKRGAAATGVAMVGYQGTDERPKVFIARSPLPAEEFVKTNEYKELNAKKASLEKIGLNNILPSKN